ncbi:MAG TPA: DUF2231 domain-containing protein [Chthoniobacteraceae bacterium]
MNFVFGRVLLLTFAAAALAHGAEAPKEDPLKLTQKVHDIFEAKCVDCHGPELPRPKGKFGYILDLERVAANPDYVVPGKPDKSDLYNLVEDDEMPGEDANVPPLTPEEKAAVKRWIEIGAPSKLPGTAERQSHPQAPPPPPEPFWRHLWHWAGRFHPVMTHFPVSLLMMATLAELLGWLTKRESWMQTVRFLLVLGAAGAVAAAGSGWVNAYFSSYNKAPWALLWWHRWFGTATAVWAVICACASFSAEGEKPAACRGRLRIALLLGAALVGLSGFLGSALIYGLDHYAWR